MIIVGSAGAMAAGVAGIWLMNEKYVVFRLAGFASGVVGAALAPCLLELRKQQPHLAMAKNHGPQIKDDEQYEALRKEGASKEKAARIANSDRGETAKKGGKSAKYEEWTKADLYGKAKEIGIEGRSGMDKSELIDALRNH